MNKLLDGVTVTGDSEVLPVGRPFRGDYRMAKVAITGGSATVALYGRADGSDPVWEKITEFTASGTIPVRLLTQIKFTISAISGATVHAWVDGYKA